MKTYKVVIAMESIVEAEDANDALDRFWEELEKGAQHDMTYLTSLGFGINAEETEDD